MLLVLCSFLHSEQKLLPVVLMLVRFDCYAGELIAQPRQRWTPEQQLELLDTHPIFTGKCPHCGYEFQRDYTARIHWDCPECGWADDTVSCDRLTDILHLSVENRTSEKDARVSYTIFSGFSF
ncbi:hypothetical protein [Scytonema sp. PCC 10023]|uniref:hypothetical protein n=1 Tax=Scytonema sp. PCC 10023 TaxID=1680591 RepID=UPI0039C5F7FE